MTGSAVDYAGLAFDAVDEFERYETSDEVADCMARVLSRFGFTSFLIVDIPEAIGDAKPAFLLNGWPLTWAEHYLRENY
jgi:hypothetical protein